MIRKIRQKLQCSSANLQYKEQPMDTNFPADSPESRYLSQAIDKQIQALEKSGAPRVSVPTPAPKKDLAALVAEEKEKWGLA